MVLRGVIEPPTQGFSVFDSRYKPHSNECSRLFCSPNCSPSSKLSYKKFQKIEHKFI